MPVTVTCPACGRPALMAPGDGFCPHCGTAIPESLKAAVHDGMRTDKPRLIKVMTVFLAIWVLLAAVMGATTVFGSYPRYTINGVEASQGEFTLAMGKVFLLPILLGAAAAWGLYRERLWGRPVTLVLAAVCILTPYTLAPARPGGPGMLVPMAAGLLMFLGPAYWYFYRKKNVAAYYRQIARRG